MVRHSWYCYWSIQVNSQCWLIMVEAGGYWLIHVNTDWWSRIVITRHGGIHRRLHCRHHGGKPPSTMGAQVARSMAHGGYPLRGWRFSSIGNESWCNHQVYNHHLIVLRLWVLSFTILWLKVQFHVFRSETHQVWGEITAVLIPCSSSSTFRVGKFGTWRIQVPK